MGRGNKQRKTDGVNPRVYKTWNPNTEIWSLLACIYEIRQNESQKEDETDG